ncbi:MAG: hypothetical protein ACRCYN_10785, partial [Plesiomonas sp.]
MMHRLSRSVIATLLTTAMFNSCVMLSPAYAALPQTLPELSTDQAISQNLPDIGTAGGSVLSINQEIELGDFYLRQ